MQVWANYRDSHQGWATFLAACSGHTEQLRGYTGQASTPNITVQSAYLRDSEGLLLIGLIKSTDFVVTCLIQCFHYFIDVVNVQIQADAESNKKNHVD